MLKKGCLAYLCAIEIVETQEPDLREIPIVQEFLEFSRKYQVYPQTRR